MFFSDFLIDVAACPCIIFVYSCPFFIFQSLLHFKHGVGVFVVSAFSCFSVGGMVGVFILAGVVNACMYRNFRRASHISVSILRT